MLNGISYVNNSVLNLLDIGEGGSALICQTDSTQCCRGTDNPNGGTPLGNWFLPNSSQVRNSDVGGDINMDRGASVVRLNRRNSVTSPTGVYRCEVVDARGNTQDILVELQTCKFQILRNLEFFSPFSVDACIDKNKNISEKMSEYVGFSPPPTYFLHTLLGLACLVGLQ